MSLAAAVRGSTEVHVPEVYSHLSSSRMLTMEWVTGVKVGLPQRFVLHCDFSLLPDQS